jgi:hypothetical protein
MTTQEIKELIGIKTYKQLRFVCRETRAINKPSYKTLNQAKLIRNRQSKRNDQKRT